MHDAFEAVTRTVGKCVRSDAPLSAHPKVWLLSFGNPILCNISHLSYLGAGFLDILLHAKPGGLWEVLTISYSTELAEVCLDILADVFASVSRD